MNMLGLFPTPVGTFEMGRQFTEEELSFIKNLETRNNTGNHTSTDSYILKRKELSEIRDFIEKSLIDYFIKVFSPQDNVKLEITQSWINYTAKGQWHHSHAHPNSLVSGVFYINADREKDRIYFNKQEYSRLKLLPKEWHIFNSETWWLEAYTGGLIIFPSELNHHVAVVETEEPRISLSFNTFPRGFLGDPNNLTELVVN